MKIIPAVAKPSQTLYAVLSDQATTLRLYQKFYGLYVDILINDVLIIGGVICRDRNRTVRSAYFNFVGDVAFFDTQGSRDPDYTGVGGRYQLAYFLEDEISQFGIT